MNRAARREPILGHEELCMAFIEGLSEVPDRFGARIHGYVLMPTHYHLMVEVPEGNLSQVMAWVGGRFSQKFNRRFGHDGPVFRGRFHNAVVEDDDYWMHLLAYLHLNPLAAHLVPDLDEFRWSSHLAYVGDLKTPDWLWTDELLHLFGSREDIQAYEEEVRLRRRHAPEGFDPERFFRAPTTEPALPTAPAKPQTVDEALAEVAEVMGVEVESLLGPRRWGGRGQEATWVAARWLAVGARLNQREIAELLGVSRSRVSQLQRQALRRRHTSTVGQALSALAERRDRGE